MRLFDLIGAAAVAAWLSLVGFYVSHVYFDEDARDLAGGVIIEEGDSWMLLTREEQEVGYIHETRTRLDGDRGWLLEYDLLINVKMLGAKQFLRTNIRASVDPRAFLDEFAASIETAATTFKVQGHVDETTVTMTMDLAGAARERTVELNERPRLSNSAVHELVAADELVPGMRFEQEYFDPTVMGMTTMTFEYVRRHTVEVYEQEVETLHFRQLVAGNELDVYVDKHGEVYIQEFPFRILGARVPAVFGRTRATQMRRDFELQSTEGVDLSVQAAVGLLKGVDAAFGDRTTAYRLTNIPEAVDLSLDSGEQRVTSRTADGVVVDVSSKGAPGELSAQAREQLLASDLRVDADSRAFADLLPVDLRDDSPTLRAEALAKEVRDLIVPRGTVAIQTASQVLEAREGDCTEFALALVAALRHHDVPARFVSGVKADDAGQFIPHQWVQYWNGSEFVDVDLTTPTMLIGAGHLQLFTHALPEHPQFVHALEQLTIEPIAPENQAPATGAASDFN